jgi:DNA repair photolyase
LPREFVRRTAGTNAAFDAGRGCPFQCSFCTIINVQGRQSRYRSPDDIEKVVRDNWKQNISRFFITDDNFARNREWEAIFDRLAKLRQVDKIPLGLMIQVDTMCHKIPRFIEKAKKAGVTRVFLGLENINPDNLAAAKKKQNKITEYRKMMLAWKDQGIFLYAGYILGFPGETPETIRRDIEIIQRELPVDLLEFNILTPLPGSEDHKTMWTKGVAMDSDLNKYDLEHPVTDHPKMRRDELQAIYEEVWGLYYTRAHIETLLKRAAVTKVPMLSLAKVLVQFSTMMQFEKVNPLQSGLIRMRHPTELRPGLTPENIVLFYARYARDLVVRNAEFVRTMRWILATAWRIAHDPKRHAYHDVALTPIEDDEDENFDYLTKTDGAKAAIDHIKKIAELTHKAPVAVAAR